MHAQLSLNGKTNDGFSQWGNLLVLTAAYKNPVLTQYVQVDLLQSLFQRTIHFLHQSSTLTNSLRIDKHILEGVYRDLGFPPLKPMSSFSSSASQLTPKLSVSAPATHSDSANTSSGCC